MPPSDPRPLRVCLCLALGFFLLLLFSLGYSYMIPGDNLLFFRRLNTLGQLHREAKFSIKALALGVMIVGAGVALRHVSPGVGLIATGYLVDAVQQEVFHVWEGGRVFEKDFLAPWISLILAVFLCWAAFRRPLAS